MTTTGTTWTEETVNAADTPLQLVTGGDGEPLLIIHDELGHQAWLNYQETLAKNYKLYIPSHPGYGTTPALPWIMNMRDMAGWYLHALDDLGLGQVNVMGKSMGGWLASELATMCPSFVKKLVLVAPMGIKPPTGQIYDMFLELAPTFITEGFLNPDQAPEFKTVCPDDPSPELRESWEVAREESARLGWRPYMYYPALPDLLTRLSGLPTLIVWGRQDAIVPLSAGEVYQKAIQGSQLEVLEDCGHHPEIEKADEFTALVQRFLSGS